MKEELKMIKYWDGYEDKYGPKKTYAGNAEE